ncbi:MAG: hypothetical protein KDA62_23095, partial [Planctomycetales bacterium]|nr:hypothetical protein [Planctomycetales bacterium]
MTRLAGARLASAGKHPHAKSPRRKEGKTLGGAAAAAAECWERPSNQQLEKILMTDFCDWRRVALFLIGIVAAGSAWGQTGQTQTLQLIHPQRELGGWTFDNGREFPGAEGKLELATVDDAPTLLLH